MNNEQIRETIEYFKKEGTTIRVRDIAYTFLSKMFNDPKTAYQCLFGQDGFEEYSNDFVRYDIEEYMVANGFIRSAIVDDVGEGITFKQNKREMEALLNKTQIAMDNGLIDPKDGLKLIADIRVKLNDKFNMEKENKERQIIVEKKFDFICPQTRRECYQLDKVYAMKKWNLVENNDIIENDKPTE